MQAASPKQHSHPHLHTPAEGSSSIRYLLTKRELLPLPQAPRPPDHTLEPIQPHHSSPSLLSCRMLLMFASPT